jgi:hypothetical protein
VPDIAVESGEVVRAHLGYAPTGATVEGEQAELHGRTVSWRIAHAGPFTLFTKSSKGDASYFGCAVVR